MNQTTNIPTLDEIRQLIGSAVIFHGELYQIIEVLEDGPAVVLQANDQHTTIQGDQYGEAHRRVPETITIAVFQANKEGLNADFMALDIIG